MSQHRRYFEKKASLIPFFEFKLAPQAKILEILQNFTRKYGKNGKIYKIWQKYGKKSKNMANPGKSQNPGKIYGMTPKSRQMPGIPGNLGTLTAVDIFMSTTVDVNSTNYIALIC